MNKEFLKLAQASLGMQDVYLHSSNITAKDDFFPFSGLGSLTVQFKNHIHDTLPLNINFGDETRKGVRYRYSAAFRVLRPGIGAKDIIDEADTVEKTLVEVAATFAAIYQVTQDIPKEAIDEFARFNVGYHVWPYWREYASSTATRLRLPAFAIPMYRIPEDDNDS